MTGPMFDQEIGKLDKSTGGVDVRRREVDLRKDQGDMSQLGLPSPYPFVRLAQSAIGPVFS